MILGKFRLYAFGALLAGFAAPSLAASGEPVGAANAEAKPMAPAYGKGAVAGHSRKVDLPFLLDSGSHDREPQAPARQGRAEPHPFREVLLQKASFDEAGSVAAEPRDPRLSHSPNFS